MKLELHRTVFGPTCTTGKLSVDGVFECYTLEDVVREPFVKVDGRTAIPAGTYNITVNMSERFHRMMPLLTNVPQFEGVRIHPGNTATDTEGCILVGKQIDATNTALMMSRIAFDMLYAKIDREFGRGQQMSIQITNDRQEAKSA